MAVFPGPGRGWHGRGRVEDRHRGCAARLPDRRHLAARRHRGRNPPSARPHPHRAPGAAGRGDRSLPEYTGNGASFFHLPGDPAWHRADTGAALVSKLDRERNGLVWLQPAPADNGWGIAVPDRLARAGWRGLPDLARNAGRGERVRLAASVEFVEAADALPAFERAYGFRLRQDQLLMLAGGDTAATIRAASEGVSGVNAAMAYGTDGALDALGMVLLDDPLHAQIVFQPAPVIREATLAVHPGIRALLAPVFAALTLPVLRRLNGRIAVEGDDAASVADGFLASLEAGARADAQGKQAP